jgi:hypothetical protein
VFAPHRTIFSFCRADQGAAVNLVGIGQALAAAARLDQAGAGEQPERAAQRRLADPDLGGEPGLAGVGAPVGVAVAQ